MEIIICVSLQGNPEEEREPTENNYTRFYQSPSKVLSFAAELETIIIRLFSLMLQVQES